MILPDVPLFTNVGVDYFGLIEVKGGHSLVQRYGDKGIECCSHPPTGSHHGGAWEQIIRLVRKVLYSIIKQQSLDAKRFHTMLCEVEAIFNDHRNHKTERLRSTHSQPHPTVKKNTVDILVFTKLEVSSYDLTLISHTQRSMPVTKDNIFKAPYLDAEVDLLFDTNTPKLLEPWEIINSCDNGPYAVRTLLRWVVNGSLRVGESDSGTSSCHTVTVNKIEIARVKDLLIAQYNQDFNEKTGTSTSAELYYWQSMVYSASRVYHPKKKTLRLVFDYEASFKGTSLNNLLKRPDLTNSLFGVLTRFTRQEPIALMADIKAMFHQVKVSQKHVDFLHFLWWPNDVTQNLIDYRMKVHLFGTTSSPSCANYALRRVAEDNKTHFKSEVMNTIQQNFYVADCLQSLVAEALQLVKNLTAPCSKGGFQLSKRMSISHAVLASIPGEHRLKATKELNLDNDHLPVERALGLRLWCSYIQNCS
ncbi:hypothetical protein N1851_007616 [Merluccius polli]|uniref:Uncharacterized protein n=1 Tax=Merluccius polli TaxID=89951 RepID=A0AA47N2L3_MERPO|nr:hypothetical protein N1851_007616 [Merluccius polli]